MPYDAVFNANEVKPTQFGGGSHPIGNKFPFTITNTAVEPTKDGNNGRFTVELTSQAGSIKINFNLFHSNETTRNISKGQLATLCNAVNIYTVDFKNDGAALRGGVGLMDVGFQKGQEPSVEKPEGGYVEVKKIYDKNGNDPTQGGSGQQQNNNSGFTQQNTQQPNNQQNNAANQTANWNAGNQQQQQQNNNQQTNVQQGWNNGGQQSNQPDPNQNQQQQGGWNNNGQSMGNQAPWQK